MSLQYDRFRLDHYHVETEIYVGPLDLLLELIEKAELDITKVSLAQVTDQYLDYLKKLESREPAEVSAFLVIAAKLLQIKSEALLPCQKPSGTIEEDLGESLALQLIAYKKFKKISVWLANRENDGLRTYLHISSPPKIEGKLDLSGVSIDDLFNAAQTILLGDTNQITMDNVVSIPLLSIQKKIRHILKIIKSTNEISFHQILGERASRIDIVVTFLALLELIKQHILEAEQPYLFSDILFNSVEFSKEYEEFDLDLGD